MVALVATVARRHVMVYPNKVVAKDLARRVKERGKLLDYSDALEVGEGLWVTFSPDKDPYTRAYFWKVVNGDLVPVELGELVETFLGNVGDV